MLVLSRKKNQSIHIAGNIIIKIVDISSDTIKIGIDAPRDVEIYRSEVLEAILKENQQAVLPKTELDILTKILNFSDQKYNIIKKKQKS